MGLNINLFVHGVPMGQKIWGPKGDDERFMSSFYGPKWDAPELLKVDVMTFGGTTHCYYSFVKGQNVCDSQGRAGSYFALTLRINAFYADVQNMYNILKAVYDKMCVGLCIQSNNGCPKYMIADFKNVDDKLKDIEKRLLNYISEFSIGDDIISLSGFSTNSQAPSQSVNLFECTNKVAIDIVKKTGKLVVSPCYLSTSAAKTVAQYKAEVQTTIQKAQQEISLCQKTSQEKIAAITKESDEKIELITRKSKEELQESREQSRIRLEQVKEESEKKIANVKQEYADVDNKIDSLKHTISELKKKYENKEKENRNLNTEINKLQKQIGKLQGEANRTNMEDMTPSMPEPKRINWWVVGAISFFTVFLVGVLGFFAKRYINTNEEYVGNLLNQISELEEENDSLRISLEDFSRPRLPEGINPDNITIDIKEFSKNKQSIKKDEICHISLKGEGIDSLQGSWFSNGLIIRDNTIMVKPDNTDSICELHFVIGNDTITRKINIQKDPN